MKNTRKYYTGQEECIKALFANPRKVLLPETNYVLTQNETEEKGIKERIYGMRWYDGRFSKIVKRGLGIYITDNIGVFCIHREDNGNEEFTSFDSIPPAKLIRWYFED